MNAAPAVAPQTSRWQLTDQQRRDYEALGYVGPLTLCSPDEMAEIFAELQRTVIADGRGLWMRHLNTPMLYQLCCRRELTDAVASLLGEDLVIWRCRFLIKDPGVKAIPWHQDAGYWKDLDPLINVSVWLALNDVDRANACVKVIPGSHRRSISHVSSGASAHEEFELTVEPDAFEENSAVCMELRAGQFFLFSENIVHGSDANTSNRQRAGLSIRITTPEVRIRINDQSRPILMRGEDRFGYNRLASPPQL